jgi:hypothetical protein
MTIQRSESMTKQISRHKSVGCVDQRKKNEYSSIQDTRPKTSKLVKIMFNKGEK